MNTLITILKVALAIFVTACVLLVGTYFYISVQLPASVKAIGPGVVLIMTVYSPIWWLLVVVVVAAAWWLSRRWLF